MNPLKYIAAILAQFSKSQRVIALLLLLLTITVVSVTPKLIESLTHNDSAFSERIEAQKLIIIKLNNDADSLNNVIRRNQLECTNQIVNRETEILDKISHLTNTAKNSETNRFEVVASTGGTGSTASSVYSDKKVMMSPPPPPNEESNNNELLNGLLDIKKDIQRSIKNKKGR